MFVLFLVILLWPRTDAGGGSVQSQWSYCHKTNREYCLQLSDSVTAEVGLCAVIHCSFNTPQDFKPSSLVWYKCAGAPCSDSDIIFDSKKQNKIQSSFSGRVSLLESDLSQKNCSIIINDLHRSDSGTYVLRLKKVKDGFTFNDRRATISVTALQQKPTVLSPALTEGQNASITCIAPGLCSGSEPTFTWTWRGAGEVPNITTATTDRLTPVNHRHSSTLELTASAELHGAELNCKVSYKSSSTQDSVRINVTYVKVIEVSGDTVVKEGDSLNVTCSVDSFPPSRLMWFGPNKTSLNVSETSERLSQTDLGSASLLIHNMSQAQSGQYMCEGLHLNSSQSRHINISVIYLRKPILFRDTSVKEGSVLNLTCTVDSFPPSIVTIRKCGEESTKQNKMHKYKTDPGSASLVILNVTSENAGVYECTVQHELKNQTTHAHVIVLYSSQNISPVVSLEVILAFALGFLLSSALCYLIMACRRKQKSHPTDGNTTAVEMLNGNVADEANGSAEPRELHYASINFAAMVGRGPTNRTNVENTESEYTEIKREIMELAEDNGEVREEPPAEEEAAMMEEKVAQNELDEQDVTAVYSNVKRMMKE